MAVRTSRTPTVEEEVTSITVEGTNQESRTKRNEEKGHHVDTM